MALTYGGTYAKSTVGTGNPHTFTYTCPANSRVICLFIEIRSVTARSGTPTYNGVNMTQAGTTNTAAAEVSLECWYLINPPIGSAYTVSIPNAGGLTMTGVCAAGVSASATSAGVDITNGWIGSTLNPSNLVVTGAAGCWVMDGMSHGLATAETGRGQTLIKATDEGQWNDANSYANQASAGSITFSHTIAADNWAQIIVAFKEVTSQTYEVSSTFSGSGALSDSGIMTIGVSNSLTSSSSIGEGNAASLNPSLSLPSTSLMNQGDVMTIETANLLVSSAVIAESNIETFDVNYTLTSNSLISETGGLAFISDVAFNSNSFIQESDVLLIDSDISLLCNGAIVSTNLNDMGASLSFTSNGSISHSPNIDFLGSLNLTAISDVTETNILQILVAINLNATGSLDSLLNILLEANVPLDVIASILHSAGTSYNVVIYFNTTGKLNIVTPGKYRQRYSIIPNSTEFIG